jgi:hypothetical protein
VANPIEEALALSVGAPEQRQERRVRRVGSAVDRRVGAAIDRRVASSIERDIEERDVGCVGRCVHASVDHAAVHPAR